MAPSYDHHSDLVLQARAQLDSVGVLLPQAAAIQWNKSPARRGRPKEDTTERSLGGPPSDPTADVVLDDARLHVRDAVQRAETLLTQIEHASARLAADLEKAIAGWVGDPD